MSETFGPDFITVTDEDGNEFELELVDTLEHNGITYHAPSRKTHLGSKGITRLRPQRSAP